MTPPQDNPQPENEDTYDRLISLIENSQGRLAPIIVACDDQPLRQTIIQRYEAEARQAQIRSYRIVLGQEPSVRAGLAALKDKEPHLQQGGEAVFTVTGAELLLRVKLDPQAAQSELDKFFGYLQWTREGLREFPYPIVLWVSYRILHELSRRAPDFWSWRKAVLRFTEESPQTARTTELAQASFRQDYDSQQDSDESLPPLDELQAEIAELTAKDPTASGLATLYDRLGQVYAQMIRQGLAPNVEQAREQAIAAFQAAIRRYHHQSNPAAEMGALIQLGSFLRSQSCYAEAIDGYQKALAIAQEIGDRYGEAKSLTGLGLVYDSLGDYQRAIDAHQQSLAILQTIGDRQREAVSLNNLASAYSTLGDYQRAIEFYQQSLAIDQSMGNRGGEGIRLCNLGHVYQYLGQHQRAIELYQQALEVQREVGNRHFEANSLMGLGNAYSDLENYQRALEFYTQALAIKRRIGDRHNEAHTLYSQAISLAKLDRPWEALQAYQQAKQIYAELGLDHEVEKCDAAIYELHQVIPAVSVSRAPKIREEAAAPRRRFRLRRQQVFWVVFGVVLGVLLWWLAGL